MKLSIHQPNFIPWMGYFRKISLSDAFVLLDHVQFTKNSYQNRAKIKTPAGEHWLTVPVLHKGRFGQSTRDVEINNGIAWGKKLWQTLTANYAKAPYFQTYADSFEGLLSASHARLVDLNEAAILAILRFLEIDVRVLRSSEMNLSGVGSDLILEICKTVGAETYVSGSGGKKYMDLDAFERAGVKVVFNPFQCPEYPQRFGDFIPNLSVVDLLFNCGPDSAKILRQSGGV